MDTLPIELLQHIVFYLIPTRSQATPSPTCKAHHNHNFTAIFTVRLVNQALAAAASHAFDTIIQTHTWTLNTTSLTRLANLLLNIHVAKRTCRLTFNTYLFSLDRDYTLETAGSFDRAVTARKEYLDSKAAAQLTKVFGRAKALRHVFVMPTILEQQHGGFYDAPWLHGDDVVQARIPNPLICLRNALRATRVHRRLVAVRISDPDPTPNGTGEIDIAGGVCGVPNSLVCSNITRLGLDAVCVVRFRVPLVLECAGLQVLEMLHVERLTALDFELQSDDRGIEGEAWTYSCAGHQRRWVLSMLESVKNIHFLTCADTMHGADTQACVVSAAILEGLVGYLARYKSSLETQELRDMVVEGKTDHVDVVQSGSVEEKKFSIRTMRLVSVQWEQVPSAWALRWHSERDDEGVVTPCVLRCTVDEVILD